MTEWRRRFIEGPGEPPPPKLMGERCSRCLEEMTAEDVYGRRGKKTLCAFCADDEWDELTDEEKLELLGYEVVR